MANLAYIDDSNLCKNNYYHALATEYIPNPPQLPQLITLASLTLVPVDSASHLTPLSPTTIPRLQPSESTWPSVTRWPVPLLHWHPHSLQQQCQGMSCLPSLIPSSAWDRFPTKDATSFLPRPPSPSTTPMAIPFSQAGRMRLDHASGTSLSPLRPPTHRMRPLPQCLSLPARHHLRLLCQLPLSCLGPCQPQ
jgi:hypothetical protein